jgi:hypothetical protein
VFLDGEVEGAALLTPGARNAHRLFAAARAEDVVTLSRLWLSDRLPRNAESRVLSIIIRILRRDGRHKILVTFADPAVAHAGGIYRAAGFVYLGVTQPETVLLIGGSARHPRSAFSALGSNDVGHLSRTGVAVVRARTEPKHRFAVAIDPTWRWRLPMGSRYPTGPHEDSAPSRLP